MNVIRKLVRKSILELQPYSSARDEFKGREAVFLDANENPFGELNRYPDPYQTELKKEIAGARTIPVENIFVGNGSDEVIDLSFRIFCEPQKDKILICPPTYGMYKVSADINNVEVVEAPLTSDFQLDIPAIKSVLEKEPIKIIFLCSPNNPTGNDLHEMEEILGFFKGIVIVDEAYIDFSQQASFIEKIAQRPNLIVSQTFSKARALAGARVGMAFANQEIIRIFNRVKPPYNVSALNQAAALKALKDKTGFQDRLELILEERNRLMDELKQLKLVKKIFPTEANFILIQVEEATKLYNQLADQKIIIRNRSSQISEALRITVGTPEENQLLIERLKDYEKSIVY